MNKNNSTAIYFLVCLSMLFITNACSENKRPPVDYQIDAITISPEFAIARKTNLITVTASLTANFPEHSKRKLTLEQRLYRHDGWQKYRPVAHLRDDGKKGDQQANDGVFTAVFSVTPAIEQSIHYRIVVHPQTHHSHFKKHSKKFILGNLELPVKNGCGPVGEILPLKIITPERNKKQYTYSFDIPEVNTIPRETILRVVNGAQINAPLKNRVDHAKIQLNGNKLLKVRKSINIAEIPITLKTGHNTLSVRKIHGKRKQRLAITINACADNITIKPIDHTLVAGSERLQASATLTAYGLPVANAEVEFNISNDLTETNSQTTTTSVFGIANHAFTPINSGTGQLSASAINANPELIDSTTIKVISEPSIRLNQGFEDLQLISGSQENIPFFLFYLLKNASAQQLSVQLGVEPDNGGLQISGVDPVTHYNVNQPASFTIEPVVTAVHAGDYSLTAIATNLATGETSRKTTLITVQEVGAPDPLILGAPGLTPSGVPVGSSQQVTVRALAQESSTPPDSLWLDEVDSDDKLIRANIAELKDDGHNGDNIADDLEYSAQLKFDRAEAQDIFVRVRANYFDKEVISTSNIFSISPFDLQGPAADPKQLITDDNGEDLIFANELLIKLLPATSPTRAQQITASVNGEIVSIIPELQLYRIQFFNDGSLATLQKSIATLNEFSEVIDVSKNTLVTPAGTNCDWSNPATNCPQDPLYTGGQQWHINKIHAKEAWYAARNIDSSNFAGSTAYPVAVIDNGVDCTHSELSSHCTYTPGETGNGSHATKVAAIIAAEANGQNGVGVAWNSPIISFNGGISSNSLITAITNAGNSTAKILNISMTTQTSSSATIRTAVCNVAKKGKLIVAAAGQPSNSNTSGILYYPAALNSDTGNCPTTNGTTVKLAEHLFAVGAADASDNRATWVESSYTFGSNQVNWIDLYAPGKNIIAFNPSESDQNGTSFATPQVSAATAMLWPLLPIGTSASTLHQRLINNADVLSDIDGDGIQDKHLNILSALGKHKLTVNFVNESAAFHNSFGIYNRSSGQAQLLVDNVDLNSNPSITSFESIHYLTDDELANLEFFLIPNGATMNASYLQSTAATARSLQVFQDTDGKWRIQDTNGTVLRGPSGEADALFSETAKNPDGRIHIHTSGSSNNYHLFWEDRPAPISDFDFNDAEFRIIIQ